MPLRFDRAELPKPERTKEGFLRTVAVVARPGVLVYPKRGGGEVRELVTAEVLAASAQGIADNVLTLRHPLAADGTPIRVTKDNADKYSIGHSGGNVVINEDGSIAVPVTITHAKGIEAIDNGMRGVSPLYDVVTVDAPPGSVHPTFGRYDKIQTSRTYAATTAICPLGRGGPQCHLRADDAEAMIEIEGGDEAAPDIDAATESAIAASEVRADELPAAVAPEAEPAADLVKAMLAMLGVATVDEAWAKINSEWSELCAKRDALGALLTILQVENAEAAREKLAALTAPPAPAPEVRADSVEARAWFHRRAKLHAAAIAAKLPDPDAMDDAALRKAVVLARQPSLRADASDAFYEAAFELAAPVDHLAPLRLPGKPATPAIRADESASKPSTNRWNDAFNVVPARS